MSKYLDLTAEQSREIRAEGKVRRWVRMEPQPAGSRYRNRDGQIVTGGGYFHPSPNDQWQWFRQADDWDVPISPPHPPGTRARVREECWIDREPHEAIGCLRAFFPTDGYCHFEDGRPGGHSPFIGGPEWTLERRADYYASNGSLEHFDAAMVPDWAIRTEATCTAVVPAVHDGAWGFLETWEVEG